MKQRLHEQDQQDQLVRIGERGQMVLPAKIRRELKVGKGDLVRLKKTDDGYKLVPQMMIDLDALNEIGESLRAKGFTLKDFLEFSEKIRPQLMKELYNIDISASNDKKQGTSR